MLNLCEFAVYAHLRLTVRVQNPIPAVYAHLRLAVRVQNHMPGTLLAR